MLADFEMIEDTESAQNTKMSDDKVQLIRTVCSVFFSYKATHYQSLRIKVIFYKFVITNINMYNLILNNVSDEGVL